MRETSAVLSNSPPRLPRLTDAVVVIGSEGRGLSEGVRRLVTRRVTIPRFGAAESLNAAVAAAITKREKALAAFKEGRVLAAADLLTLGALAERFRMDAHLAHRKVPSRYARTGGRRWHRLVRAMAEATEEAARA